MKTRTFYEVESRWVLAGRMLSWMYTGTYPTLPAANRAAAMRSEKNPSLERRVIKVTMNETREVIGGTVSAEPSVEVVWQPGERLDA